MARAGSKPTDDRNQRTLPRDRRGAGPFALATIIHAGLVAAFLHSLAAPREPGWVVTSRPRSAAPTEQLRYAAISREIAVPVPRIDENATAYATTGHARQPLNDAGAPATDTASGGIPGPGASSGAGDAAPRHDARDPRVVVLLPMSADPRIWSVPSKSPAREPTRAEVLEESLARGVRASNDSIATLGVQTIRPDWVLTRDGRKYGLDNVRIHIGALSLPAVVLGALPIAGFGCMPTMYFPDRPVRDSAGIACLRLENSTVAERNERIDEMSAEIRARAAITASAREEVARIDARKNRERAARLRAATGAPPDSSLGNFR